MKQLVFPSREWVNSLCEEINLIGNSETKDWNWSILFIIKNLPIKMKNEYNKDEFIFKVNVKNGICLGIDFNEKDADYILEGDYGIWKSIIKGEIDVATPLLTGKIKLIKGDRLRLLRHIRSAINIAYSLRSKNVLNNTIFID